MSVIFISKSASLSWASVMDLIIILFVCLFCALIFPFSSGTPGKQNLKINKNHYYLLFIIIINIIYIIPREILLTNLSICLSIFPVRST